MPSSKPDPTRRDALRKLGVLGTTAALGSAAGAASASAEEGTGSRPGGGDPPSPTGPDGFTEALRRRVEETPIVDTHEHLGDEDERLRGEMVACDDWGVLFSHYIDSDLVSAGMSDQDRGLLSARGVALERKWKILEPWWPHVKYTGYGRVVRIVIQELYGIEDLSAATVGRLRAAYESVRKPGFYRRILRDLARIESCQVNYLGRPFKESRDPTLLMQDLSIIGMHMGPDIEGYSKPAGKDVKDLADWHGVIDWWFETYGPWAVAVKSQAAYSRGLDYDRVPAEKAEPVFQKRLRGDPVTPEERKALEDHLFWYAVAEATRRKLPVKLHTGYYAGANNMPIARLRTNPQEAAELCRKSPDTTFVFMHIAYPYWQDLVAVAKHWTGAHIDMCWAWIVDPAQAKEFLKSFLTAAPANKVLTFGGDYLPVECVLGHARIARRGIARALRELVEDGWLEQNDAIDLVEPLLRGNARRIFRLDEKTPKLERAPWLSS
jgi:predicted TIM-barrel fold metal-dependent hydrolase